MSGAFMAGWADFHFLRPFALLLVFAVPLFWLAWRHGRADAGAWRAAIDAHLLPHLIERIDGGPGRAGIMLAALLWTLACLALAGPAWEREPMPLYRNQAARVLALELAPTMLAQDEKPNRLSRARYKIEDILARSRDYQTALIGYGGDAFIAAPLTDDVGTVRNLVDALDPTTMPVAGNATARAIDSAAALIEQAGLHHGEIILLADSAGAGAVAAARKAHERGFSVSVLGIGGASGAPVPLAQGDFLKDDSGNVTVSRLDEAGLRAVADAGGGRYANLSPDARDLDALLADRVDSVDRNAQGTTAGGEIAESARWRDRGPWLLLLLVPLALLGFRRGWLMMLVLAMFAQTPPAQAASFADLWQRTDQQAARALANGDAKQAAAVARAPEWRAGAEYKAGNYEAAAADYAKTADADGAYNRGNALARLGRYEDAIAAYDEALKRAPGMTDAQANRSAVEEFLKRQKQQDSQQPQNGKNSEQQDAKDQQPSSGQDSQQQAKDKNQGGQQDQPQNQQQGGQQDSSQSAASGEQDAEQKQRHQDTQKDNAQQDQQGSSSGTGAEKQEKAAQADTQKPDAEQQKALSQSIDQSLADKARPDDKDGKPQAAVTQEDEATREKRQALDHLLQRVPDDPGGLLRRKFQLEYQRRQQGGGNGQ
ncbi:tetratricopeptide repeat protein [Dokdonella soli]|uniref:VWA domain-containing protein n=1 Tax=Dokdonella soli TaxID=529810 RepID=A0ABP3TZ09_9GAMM